MSRNRRQADLPGPLSDVRVLEFSGLGPAPFCGMLLADLGADVVRIDRNDGPDYAPADVEARGRHSISLNLKEDRDRQLAQALATRADILIEGFRPGVMERLGLGPDVLMTAHPALVYGRITGWGQHGPLAMTAGHDLNYLAVTGALHALGSEERPAIPLNLIADFGGGAMYLMMGILSALHHARRSGEGQVVDAAMTEGVISMMNMLYGDLHTGAWTDKRESNVIDGAAPFYNVYACRDQRWLSVAAIEPAFYAAFIQAVGLEDHALFRQQWDKAAWPDMKRYLESHFAQQDRATWLSRLDSVDACVSPVLTMQEAIHHPHNQARQSFQRIDGIWQSAALPRLSRTAAKTPFGVHPKDTDRNEILARWQIQD